MATKNGGRSGEPARSAAEEFRYGPYHRLQDKRLNEMMAASGTLRGHAAKNIYQGDKPYAKAYFGRLPADRSGIEFMTSAKSGRASDRRTARWGESDPGVAVLIPGEEVEIRVKITVRREE